MNARAFVLLLPLALASRWAGALEVSLEENRAERGAIGYVDMQRLFQLYPETQKAKQNFEEVMRQAEEQVNIRKAELIGLRADLIKLRLERDALAKLAPTPPIPTPAALPPPVPPAISSPTLGSNTSSPSSQVRPGSALEAAPSVSSAPALAQLPPIVSSTTAAAVSTPPASIALPAPSSPTVSTPIPPAPAQPAYTHLPGMPDTRPATPGPVGPVSPPSQLVELDAKLAEKTKQLEAKEQEFKTYQAQVEKNLLDLEGRKTEILLGKIYSAVQDAAREAGVSVVVDKSQILFGHNAMDLTERVLKKLRSS